MPSGGFGSGLLLSTRTQVCLSAHPAILHWVAVRLFLTLGRGLLFCFPFLLDSLRGSSVTTGTIQRRLAWPLRKDDTQNSRSVTTRSTSRLLPGKEYFQIMKTKLTQKTEKVAKRLERSSQGSLPSRPAPPPTFFARGR